jgi:enterochelin esterase family protein
MARLPGTDVWYKSYRFRKDARFVYLISANDTLTPFAVENSDTDWLSTLIPDPLNRNRFIQPRDPEIGGSTEEISSVLELPDAPRQPYVTVRPGVAQGKVQLIRYQDKSLGHLRRLWVYTPPDYRRTGPPYSLLVLFDGWVYTQLIPTPTILDNLISESAIPPLVAVFIDQGDRLSELALNPGFADFVAGEIVGWTHRNYNVTNDSARTIIGGLSLGGLSAAYTAVRHPKVFGNVLSQSGAFQYSAVEEKGFIQQFALGEKLPIRFYLEAGTMEVNEAPSLLHSNWRFRDVLLAKGYTVYYSEFNGRHDYISWRGSLSQGLLKLTQ